MEAGGKGVSREGRGTMTKSSLILSCFLYLSLKTKIPCSGGSLGTYTHTNKQIIRYNNIFLFRIGRKNIWIIKELKHSTVNSHKKKEKKKKNIDLRTKIYIITLKN